MAQLPPPVHGAALRNQSIIDSSIINEEFNLYPLPLRFASDMKDLGNFSFKKAGIAISYFSRLVWILMWKKIYLAYFTMSPHGGAFYRDILFITALKLFRKKVLLHFRVKGIQKTAKSGLGRVLARFALRNSSVICLSHHHVKDIKGFKYKRLYIVPNGIKVEEKRLELLQQVNQNANAHIPKILFLSNLAKTKGVYDLVEALHKLKKKNIVFEAWIVGDEWDITFDELNSFVFERQLSNNVKVTGGKYDEEKFNMIALCDIFVFPTYFELFPGVILEAMQFEKPIVTTFEGSIPEIIDNGVNGILVPERDTTLLAEAIATLAADPEKRKYIGEQASVKFFREFTLEKFEINMKSVFTSILDNKSTDT
jgi:glycosyltransferase involved in cell wall biosynthesis